MNRNPLKDFFTLRQEDILNRNPELASRRDELANKINQIVAEEDQMQKELEAGKELPVDKYKDWLKRRADLEYDVESYNASVKNHPDYQYYQNINLARKGAGIAGGLGLGALLLKKYLKR